MNNLAKFVALTFNGGTKAFEPMRSPESLTAAAPKALDLRDRIQAAYYSHDKSPRFMSDMTFVVNAKETVLAMPYQMSPKSSPSKEQLDINFYFLDNVLQNIVMLDASYSKFEKVGNVYVADAKSLDFDWDKKLTKTRIDQLVDAAYKAASVFDRYGEPVVN